MPTMKQILDYIFSGEVSVEALKKSIVTLGLCMGDTIHIMILG